MGSHSNKELEKKIDDSGELVKKMGELRKSLSGQLASGFKELMGDDIPSMMHCKIRQVETIMQYTQEAKMDHFLKAILDLGKAAFKGDEQEIVTKAMGVAGVALEAIFGSFGVSTDLKGSSALLEHDGKDYLAAMYAVTQVCSSKQWFVQTDFIVASYAYIVTTPLSKDKLSNLVPLVSAEGTGFVPGLGFRRPVLRF